MAKIKATGFGFIPKEIKHHFLLFLPRGKEHNVVVYERFKWDNDQPEQKSELVEKNIKVIINKKNGM